MPPPVPPPINICGDGGFILRHKRWGGDGFEHGGMFVEPKHNANPLYSNNYLEGPRLIFHQGEDGPPADVFEHMAFVAEPAAAGEHPPILEACNVDEWLPGQAGTAGRRDAP